MTDLLTMDRAALSYLADCGGSTPTSAIPAKLFVGEIPPGTPDLVDLGLIEHVGDTTIITDAGRAALQPTENLGWIDQVRALLGAEFDAASKLYSFQSAFEDLLTPKQAVRDFREWLAA